MRKGASLWYSVTNAIPIDMLNLGCLRSASRFTEINWVNGAGYLKGNLSQKSGRNSQVAESRLMF